MKLRILILICAVALFTAPVFAGVILDVTNGGDINGSPGDLIGWGFTLTNNSNFVEITSAQFCVNPVSFPACGASSVGNFMDFISSFNDVIVGPGGSASQVFDANAFTGIGSFRINPGAPLSFIEAGQLVLTYNICDADPSAGGNCFASDFVSTNATLGVNGIPAVSATPEPALVVPVGAALILILARRRRIAGLIA